MRTGAAVRRVARAPATPGGATATRPARIARRPLDTAANCGGCGTACPTDRPLCGGPRGQETCRAACAAPAPDACGTSCTDPQSDSVALRRVRHRVREPPGLRARPLHAPLREDRRDDIGRGRRAARLSPSSRRTAPISSTATSARRSISIRAPVRTSAPRPPITTRSSSKFEADGSYAWTRSWAKDVYTAVTCRSPPDGSVIVTGFLQRERSTSNPGAGVTRLTAQGESDAVVLKLSASGSLVWARAFTIFDALTEDVSVFQLKTTTRGSPPDGSVYVVGSSQGTGRPRSRQPRPISTAPRQQRRSSTSTS